MLRGHNIHEIRGWVVIELRVVGVTARPAPDEQKQRLREQAQALAEPPGPAMSDEQKEHLRDEAQALAEQPEPWVRLKERIGDRVLEFGIGPAEAAAIAMALRGVRQPRPMTHDLIGNLLGALDDVSLLRVIITKREFPPELARQLADGEAVLLGETETFYAVLELQHRNRVITVDCRPSDGITVAVRLGVPIVAADELEPALATA
jgi:bifunctional DNase/RNase